MDRRQWVYVGGRAGNKPSARDKQEITAVCEKFIADVLKPRYLPAITPTPFNYPIDIFGQWHGNKYRFLQRYRSDRADAIEREFDAPFARLEYVSRDRFDLSYFRHIDKWFRLYRFVSLAQALDLIESTEVLHPV
jgi:hypothetical protein